jgi:hypothetical protein
VSARNGAAAHSAMVELEGRKIRASSKPQSSAHAQKPYIGLADLACRVDEMVATIIGRDWSGFTRDDGKEMLDQLVEVRRPLTKLRAEIKHRMAALKVGGAQQGGEGA